MTFSLLHFRILVGRISMAYFLISHLKEEEIACDHQELRPGGEWKPNDCVAIVIPYRDRKSHLVRLLAYLIPVLQRQRLDFRFIVAEQYGQGVFNKGRIMNAAFTLADALHVDCVIFHDVDLFPQDDRNLYSCADSPLHLGAYVSTLGYELPYYDLVGGVLALSAYHFKSVNGFSNMFWQWGGEDDDMGRRLVEHNYTIHRPPVEYGAYTMIKHVKRQRSLLEINLCFSYIVIVLKIYLKPLYYHMFIDVGNAPRQWLAG
ncbi:unnamed protein product [Soboliphyme baturini]|uniref:Glyco_transf_7N domain-containing protein n=1 Tax=Soboliphyme baturini TaxID=241478 RepID=A0A183ISN1_9BILA|nr:unnamed protein product [Soboliphyme baturini]